MISFFNSIIGHDPLKFKILKKEDKIKIFIRLLYKGPSVGGVCGTNLFRFFLSRFPDPVTELLSWWELLYNNTRNHHIKTIAEEMGNPFIGKISNQTLTMLLEDPTALNIPGGLSGSTAIKNKIYDGLLYESYNRNIINPLIKESIIYTVNYKERFADWLFSIKPVFPRFLSEFYTSTFFKIAESIVVTLQNSRTIKKVFSRTFPEELYKIIVKGEILSIKILIHRKPGQLRSEILNYSAEHADKLRQLSWGPNLVRGYYTASR